MIAKVDEATIDGLVEGYQKEAQLYRSMLDITRMQSEGLRRLFVNACYWCLEMEDDIPSRAKVDLVGEFKPTFFGFGEFKKGLKPADYRIGFDELK